MPKEKKRGAEDSASKVEKKPKKQKLNNSEATPSTNGTTKNISTSVIPLPVPKTISTSTIPLPTPKSITPIIPVISKPVEKKAAKKAPKPAQPISKSNSPIPPPIIPTTSVTINPKVEEEKSKDKQKEKKEKKEKKKKDKTTDEQSSKKDEPANGSHADQATPAADTPIVETGKSADKSGDTPKESKHKKKRKSKDAKREAEESQSQTVKESQSTILAETPKSKKTKHIPTEDTTNAVIQPISDALQIPEKSENTGLHLLETEMYLAVNPISLDYAVDGAIADAVSTLLLTYHEPFKGYILAHRNGQASAGKDATARCIDQYGPPYLWVTIEVLVFRPMKGAWLTGTVTMQTQSHINLVVWNYFSAKVEKNRLPSSWKFIQDEYEQDEYEEPLEKDPTAVQRYNPNKKFRRTTGAYVDGQGTKIQGQLAFRAIDFDVSVTGMGNQSIMHIDGTFLSEEDERRLVEREQQNSFPVDMVNRPRQGGAAASSSRT